ncbi:MAG: Nif11-like leader peptide family natural product precursor [Clostridia bacterium]|nr:Nif11-like leader peptide family natural product precursor [Clostridia bacterium]
MKGIKEFLELLKNDKGILAEVEKVQDDASKVVAIAKKHGYEFTEDEYNDLKMEAVAGGSGYGDFFSGLLNKGKEYLVMNGNNTSDDNYEYKLGQTGVIAQSKHDGSLWYMQNGGSQWVQI